MGKYLYKLVLLVLLISCGNNSEKTTVVEKPVLKQESISVIQDTVIRNDSILNNYNYSLKDFFSDNESLTKKVESLTELSPH